MLLVFFLISVIFRFHFQSAKLRKQTCFQQEQIHIRFELLFYILTLRSKVVPLESCLHNTTQKTDSLACKEYSINNQIIALRPTYINESCSCSNAVLEVNYGGKEKWRPQGIFGAIELLIVRWSHSLTLNV